MTDFAAIGILVPAPGDPGEPPDRVRIGDIGPFAQLLALEDIPEWSGKGPLPRPVCWVVWRDYTGRSQFLLAIAETRASDQEKSGV